MHPFVMVCVSVIRCLLLGAHYHRAGHQQVCCCPPNAYPLLPVQCGPGASVVFQRRGWDFGMQYTLQTMHEDDVFRDACEGAAVPDATDPDDLLSGPYFGSLDEMTGGVWSGRPSAHSAGMYALGAGLSRVYVELRYQ